MYSFFFPELMLKKGVLHPMVHEPCPCAIVDVHSHQGPLRPECCPPRWRRPGWPKRPIWPRSARPMPLECFAAWAPDYLTDPMSPMGDNALELKLYVEWAGLSPMEAIVCATKNNSKVLGLEDKTGTLEGRKVGRPFDGGRQPGYRHNNTHRQKEHHRYL